MEELIKIFPSLLIFLILGVPPIVFLFKGWMDEKEKRINDLKVMTADFTKTTKEVESTHSLNDGKLLEGLNGIKSLAEQIQLVVNRSNNV